MPELLKLYVESNESFLSLIFIIGVKVVILFGKNVTNQSKFLLPSKPSAKTWRRVSRKPTTLKELKESVCKTISGKKLRHKHHLNEITMMCREIRSKTLMSNSLSSAELAIDGVILDLDLTNIKYNAAENYSNYKKNYFNIMSLGCDIKVSIFIYHP